MKKFIQAALSFSVIMTLLLSFPAVVSASAEVVSVIQPDAVCAGLSASCTTNPGMSMASVTDGKQWTYYVASPSGDHIEFLADVPVKQLYFMFETPCQWTLSLPDGSVRQGGEQGFIHEYLSLDNEVTGFAMDIPGGSKLTNVYAFTEGNLPEWVQVWQPPVQKADLMVMPTHADDEHLWFGGALPYYAGELGYDVQVVYMTNHYKESRRCHEQLDGLWAVGVRNYPIISEKFYDSHASKTSYYSAAECFGHDRVLEFQVEMLRRFAPKVIIAHDIKGEYGHGAHILNATTLLEALEIYEDPSVYPESAEKYGITKVQKCYLHLWKENQIVVEWSDKKLERFGGKTAYDMAVIGFQCHKSQQNFNYKVKESDRYDCRLFGLAYTTVGNDTPGLNDMFEHVDMSDREAEKNAGKENAVETKPTEEAVSATDSQPGEKTPENISGISVFGKQLSLSDAVIVAVAAVILLAAMITVICLKRRE